MSSTKPDLSSLKRSMSPSAWATRADWVATNSSRAFKLVKGELVFFVIVKEVGSRGEEKEEGGGDSEDECGQRGTVVDNTTQWSSKTVVQLIGLHHTSSGKKNVRQDTCILHYAFCISVDRGG